MRPENINQRNSQTKVNGDNHSAAGNNDRPNVNVSHLLNTLSYLYSQLDGIRRNKETTEADGEKSTTVSYSESADDVRESYYLNRINNVMRMLGIGRIDSGSSSNSSNNISSDASVDGSSYNSAGSEGEGNFFSGLFKNAQSFGENVTDFLGNAWGKLKGATGAFVSQIQSWSNPNENGGDDNGNCAFASGVMVAREMGVMGEDPEAANGQIEELRQQSRAPSDENEGTDLEAVGQGLRNKGLNAEVTQVNDVSSLAGELNNGTRFILAVNPAKYKDGVEDSGHAVVLRSINQEEGTAVIDDPADEQPGRVVSIASLQEAMGDLDNKVLKVSNPNSPGQMAA